MDVFVLVKLVPGEQYSNLIDGYFKSPDHSARICTAFCFAEALGLLKRKYKDSKSGISSKLYVNCVRRLNNKVTDNYLKVVNDDFTSFDVFSESERIFDTCGVDFVGVFQIVTISRAWLMPSEKSVLLLVTADGPLSKAATSEGIKVWYCRETRTPCC